MRTNSPSFRDQRLKALPIVASRVGGIPDLVVPGETGLLVPPERIEPLAEAMVALLRDAALRQRMGAEARRRAECYSIEAMLDGIESLYHRLLRQKGIELGDRV